MPLDMDLRTQPAYSRLFKVHMKTALFEKGMNERLDRTYVSRYGGVNYTPKTKQRSFLKYQSFRRRLTTQVKGLITTGPTVICLSE